MLHLFHGVKQICLLQTKLQNQLLSLNSSKQTSFQKIADPINTKCRCFHRSTRKPFATWALPTQLHLHDLVTNIIILI